MDLARIKCPACKKEIVTGFGNIGPFAQVFITGMVCPHCAHSFDVDTLLPPMEFGFERLRPKDWSYRALKVSEKLERLASNFVENLDRAYAIVHFATWLWSTAAEHSALIRDVIA